MGGAAAYTVGAAAYMRTVRLKLTQSSWAEAGTELGKSFIILLVNYAQTKINKYMQRPLMSKKGGNGTGLTN